MILERCLADVFEQFFMLLVENAPGGIPDPQVDSKGRFDVTWERSGNLLGPFLINFWTILVKSLIKFLIN